MESARRFSDLIVQANRAFQRGEWEAAIGPLLAAVRDDPRSEGAADALAVVSKAYLNLENAHLGEVACLLVYRLRATLLAREQLFDSMVNLTLFNLRLKSFDEAYSYGRMAERIRWDDPDLLANMVGACLKTGRAEEATERFDELKRISPAKAGAVAKYFDSDGPEIPELTETFDLDCSDILGSIRQAAGAGDVERLYRAIRELQDRPDGRGAGDCWRAIGKVYASMLPAENDSGFFALQSYAGLAAAIGKAISADPERSAKDSELWAWRGKALGQLCLYELSVPALEKACELDPDGQACEAALHLCAQMQTLDENHPRRPDSATAMGVIDRSLPRTAAPPSGTEASDAWSARARLPHDPTELLESARQLARQPGSFWPAFDCLSRAIERLGRSDDERVSESQRLHSRAYGLFEDDPHEAVALLCEAVANAPHIAHSWQELGALHFREEEFIAAESFQERAVELIAPLSPPPPEAARFWANLANIRFERARTDSRLTPQQAQDKFRQAAEDARRAIRLGDRRAEVVLRKAMAR
jgi:tetratricopeptide (TPR) repeat protein